MVDGAWCLVWESTDYYEGALVMDPSSTAPYLCVCVCALLIKLFLNSSASSKPSVRADSSA